MYQYIFLFLISFFIYVYIGLNISDKIKNDYMLTYFWVGYILLGITVGFILLLSKFWAILINKRGPPGIRGIPGEDGERGEEGQCSKRDNLIYTTKNIKENLNKLFIENIRKMNNYEDIKNKVFYNSNENKLTNNFLEQRINLIITSKQFENILLTPPNNSKTKEKINYNRINRIGKTLEDLNSYIYSNFAEWVNHVMTLPNGVEFLTTPTAYPDINIDIENYFNNEVEKYDIWYWGSTRVFRPLKAEVCRKRFRKNNDGSVDINARFPLPDRPRIEIMTIEYSDKDTSKLTKLWSADGLKINGDLKDWKFDKKKRGNDKYSKLSEPGIYIPKIYKEPGSKKIYYPIGMVAIEENPNKKSDTVKTTILVSGDVIIPDEYKLAYIDKKTDSLKKNGKGFHEGLKQGIFLQVNTSHPDYRVLGDLFLNIEELNTNSNDLDRYNNIGIASDYNIINNFEEKKDLSYYEVLDYFGYNNPDKEYWGIVALPKICLKKIIINKKTVNRKPVFSSFQHHRYCEGRKLLLVQKRLRREYGCNRLPKKIDHLYSFNIIDAMESSKPNETYNIIRAFNKGRNNDESRKLNMIWDSTYENQSFYTIKDKYTKPEYDITKIPDNEIKEEYNMLGMGWMGHPLKEERKYSIFAYLGLIPEGIIMHRDSGRKFYIKHYGGMDMNKFVLYTWNENSKKYNKAIKVQSVNDVIFSELQATDQRFQFSIQVDPSDKNIIRLRSIFLPEYFLNIKYDLNKNFNLNNNQEDNKIGLLRPKGINVSHIKPLITLTKFGGAINNTKNKTLFILQPAFGTKPEILTEPLAKPVINSENYDKNINNSYVYKQTQNLLDIKSVNTPNSKLLYTN